MMKKTMGLLVMAYGTPNKEEDIERYYTHIRHGRPPSEEQLEDLTGSLPGNWRNFSTC